MALTERKEGAERGKEKVKERKGNSVEGLFGL